MTGAQMRCDPLFLRNEFESYGAWNIPLIKKQNIALKNIKLIPCSNTKKNDSALKNVAEFIFFLMITDLCLLAHVGLFFIC